MAETATGSELDRAITAGLERAELPESERSLVRFFLAREDDKWRDCCGGGCQPCVLAVGRAVDVARETLQQMGAQAPRRA